MAAPNAPRTAINVALSPAGAARADFGGRGHGVLAQRLERALAPDGSAARGRPAALDRAVRSRRTRARPTRRHAGFAATLFGNRLARSDSRKGGRPFSRDHRSG